MVLASPILASLLASRWVWKASLQWSAICHLEGTSSLMGGVEVLLVELPWLAEESRAR